MKQLMLMRHAKAAERMLGQDDFDRPLTREGIQDAKRLHIRLIAEGLIPPFAMASKAKRTSTTMQEVLGSDYEGQKIISAELYEASAQDLLKEIHQLDDRYGLVLIVAHNPGIHQLALSCLDQTGTDEFIRISKNAYSPGTITVLACPSERWADIRLNKNRLVNIFTP